MNDTCIILLKGCHIQVMDAKLLTLRGNSPLYTTVSNQTRAVPVSVVGYLNKGLMYFHACIVMTHKTFLSSFLLAFTRWIEILKHDISTEDNLQLTRYMCL